MAVSDRTYRFSDYQLTLFWLGVLLTLPTYFVVYDIAEKEPFYGWNPDDLRRRMIWPAVLLALWLVVSILFAIPIVLRRTSPWCALLLLWAAVCIVYLAGGLEQYLSDIAVLESPNRDQIMQLGKRAWQGH